MSISVIIPTYNRSDFLDSAVQSVVDQTFPCSELVIIDDGSNDDTGIKVKKLTHRLHIPVKYYFQENRGAAAARNTGIKMASSDFLCFLDSDDRYMPEKLSLQITAMQQNDHLISHTREIWFRREKLLNQKRKHQPRDGYIFRECLDMCAVGMSTVMVRRSLFDKYGYFDETLPCCEDYDFWLRVSVNEEFFLVPKQLTIKNGGRDDQLSVIYREGMDKYRIRSIVNLLAHYSLTTSQQNIALQELKRKCDIYGKGCLKHGKKEEGRYYLQLPSEYGYNKKFTRG